jgi:hypothetical protein
MRSRICRAGAGLHWQHDRFGGGRRGETDRRCRDGDGERSQEESADVLPSTHHACLPTGRAPTTPMDETCFLTCYSVSAYPKRTDIDAVGTHGVIAVAQSGDPVSTFIVSSPRS